MADAQDNPLSVLLAAEDADGVLNLDRAPQLPSPPTVRTDDVGALRKAYAVLKQIADVREGRAGSVMDKHLTLRDLMSEGALSINIGAGRYTGSAPGALAVGSGYIDPRPVLLTPPAITGLTAQGAFKTVILAWTLLDYANHAYVEVWRSTTDALGTAVLNGYSTANVYSDASGVVGTAYYYWVRAVAIGGALGPYNAVSGVSAALLTIGSTDLGPLVVTADKLSAGTYPNINLVPNPGSEDGVEAWTLVESTAGGGNLTANPTYKTGGDTSFCISKAAAGDGAAFGCRQMPVIPGETYAVSVKVICNTVSPALYIRVAESTTKQASGYVTGANRTGFTDLFTGNTPTAWTKHSFQYTVPAGVYYVSLSMYNWVSSGTIVQMFFDDCTFGRQITAEFMAANSIAVGTAAIQNLALVNGMFANATIDDAKINNLNAAKINAGFLGAARIDVGSLHGNKITSNTLTAGEISTTALSADNTLTRGLTVRDAAGNIILSSGNGLQGLGLLGVFGSGNICRNSDFRLATSNIPDYLAHYNNASISTTHLVADASVAFPGYQWSMVNNAALTGDPSHSWGFFFNTAATAFGSFKPNTNYIISFYAACTAGSNQMAATWNNAPVTATWLQNPTLNGTWQRYVLLINFGNSTIDVNGSFFYLSTKTLPISTTTYFSRVQIEQGDSPSGWAPAPVSQSNPILAANASTFIANAAIGNAHIADLNADKINAGSIRGRNVQGATFMTKGTYLTVTTTLGAGTVNVDNTTDFAASGSAVFYDNTGDRDVFTYTGKTATTLTGCSGVLGGHTVGAAVVPISMGMSVDVLSHELRFIGDAGGGLEEIANIGVSSVYGSDTSVALFGSKTASNTKIGVVGLSTTKPAVAAESTTGPAVKAYASGSGTAVEASSASGWAINVGGNATKSALHVGPQAARPSSGSTGDVEMLFTTGGGVGTRNATPRLCMFDGTNWIFVHDNSTFAG